MTSSDRTVQKLRDLCLSFPEATESQSWGHPNFRAGKKTFATFEVVDGRPSIAFRLDNTNVDFLVGQKNFFPTPYGRGKWVSLWADVPFDWRFVEEMLGTSYRLVALKRMISALDGQSRKP